MGKRRRVDNHDNYTPDNEHSRAKKEQASSQWTRCGRKKKYKKKAKVSKHERIIQMTNITRVTRELAEENQKGK